MCRNTITSTCRWNWKSSSRTSGDQLRWYLGNCVWWLLWQRWCQSCMLHARTRVFHCILFRLWQTTYCESNGNCDRRHCVTEKGKGHDSRTSEMEMGHISWPMTHATHHTVDPWPTWPTSHDPWSLHPFVLRMVIGGAWHGGTRQPSRSWEQKNRRLKLSLRLW